MRSCSTKLSFVHIAGDSSGLQCGATELEIRDWNSSAAAAYEGF